VGGDTGVTTLIRDGIAVAERIGERQLAGHCLEALALVHSLHGKPDSVFPIMARAETLLRATNAHASLARLYSRRSDELQARGRLGEAKIALGQVLAASRASERCCATSGIVMPTNVSSARLVCSTPGEPSAGEELDGARGWFRASGGGESGARPRQDAQERRPPLFAGLRPGASVAARAALPTSTGLSTMIWSYGLASSARCAASSSASIER
jgi:hypothetical protein